jgi:putative transposase
LNFLEGVFRNVCTKFEAELVEFGGEDDHVHLLVSYSPKTSISSLVNSLKGVSSRMLAKEFGRIHRWFHKGVLWSPSYFVSSCGGAPLEIIRRYVANQASPDPRLKAGAWR